MITHTQNLDLYSNLEEWSQNDLNLLAEFGPSEFTTAQLYQLRVGLMDKLVMSDRRYNFLFLTLFCSFGWALFGTGLMVIGLNKLAYPVFGLFTVCTAISSLGMLLLHKTAHNTGHLKHYLEVVQNELVIRKQELTEV